MTKSAGGLFGFFAPRRPKPIIISHPHAILDSSKKVIAIRAYPRETKSSAVIPIPDDQKCKVGWYWVNGKFQEKKP